MNITKREAQRRAEIKGIRDAYSIGYEVSNPYHKGGRAYHAWKRGWFRGMREYALQTPLCIAITCDC